ncbi:MAG: hypothetical protein K8I82_04975 [Anaerolineae bacterium]|nr:hypothetical protein [Anaerolineae bacterium]
MITLKEICANAREMFLNRQQHQILLDTYQNSSLAEKKTCPEAVYYAAEIYVYRGNFQSAREALDIIQEVYSQQANNEALAKAFITRARIARSESSLNNAIELLNTSRSLTTNHAVHGNADFLHGEVLIGRDIKGAMEYYTRAWESYRLVTEYDPQFKHELVQLGLRIINIAYMQAMYRIAKFYRTEVRKILQELNPLFLSDGEKMQIAHEMMQMSNFKAAWEQIEQIDLSCDQSPAFLMRVHAVRAYMAWMSDDEYTTYRELSKAERFEISHRVEQGLMFLVKGHLHLTAGEFEEAERVVRGSQLLVGDNILLKNRFRVLSGCIHALSETVTEESVLEMQAVLEYYRANYLQMEVIQCLMICGWMEKQLGREEEAREHLQECLTRCRQMGSVGSIYRYFQLAYPYIASLWESLEKVESVNQLLKLFQHRYENGINGQKPRLYALTNKPRFWVNNQKKTGYNMMLYILYLVENEEGSRDEIMALLWPNDPIKERTLNKLHVMRNDLKEVSGEWWSYEVADDKNFRVEPHFPGYYDAKAFQTFVERADFTSDMSARLLYYQKAIHLVKGDFAEGWDGKFFAEQRQKFKATYLRILAEGIQLADAQNRPDLVEQWTKKLNNASDHAVA